MKKAPPQERMSLERKPAEGQKLAEGTNTAEALSLSCTVSKRDQIRSHWTEAIFPPILASVGAGCPIPPSLYPCSLWTRCEVNHPKESTVFLHKLKSQSQQCAETSHKKTLSLLLKVQSQDYPGELRNKVLFLLHGGHTARHSSCSPRDTISRTGSSHSIGSERSRSPHLPVMVTRAWSPTGFRFFVVKYTADEI